MKKISILLCMCILLTLASVGCKNSEEASATDINSGVLLYFWHNDYAGSSYKEFTDNDLEELTAINNEFIMIPIVNINYYVDKNGVTQEIISMDDISGLMTSDLGWTNSSNLAQVKREYIDVYNNLAIKKYTLNDYVDEAVAFAQRIVAIKPDVRLWFSVPTTAMHALSHLQGPIWNEYVIDAFKDKVGSEIWDNNIMGLYFANEDAYPGYTKFNPDNVDNAFDNRVVMAMRDVSEKIHSYGKSMVWIPYCIESEGFGWEMYRRVAYIANKTDIFDAVTIQPKIYFGQNTADEIGFLKESIDTGAFIDPETGEVVGEKKTSSTRIGIEIELDAKMLRDEEAKTRFNTQFDYFKPYVGKIPFTFYAGAPQELMQIKDHIAEFLATDSSTSSAE
ncbi:MAG TPA: DUF4855 domain-containing protein [Firmicutes bacterium]|nr:DUF4855 domain-containing protein [Bacillota bacterium]